VLNEVTRHEDIFLHLIKHVINTYREWRYSSTHS